VSVNYGTSTAKAGFYDGGWKDPALLGSELDSYRSYFRFHSGITIHRLQMIRIASNESQSDRWETSCAF
jgi:hypothetical protein